MDAKLVIVGGKANKSEVFLRLPTIIGRSREADLTIAHPMVSRQHCELYEDNGLLMVRDLGSLNGTFIRRERITEATPLRPNDELMVGPLTFLAEYDYVEEIATAPQVAPAGEPGFDFAGPPADFFPPVEEPPATIDRQGDEPWAGAAAPANPEPDFSAWEQAGANQTPQPAAVDFPNQAPAAADELPGPPGLEQPPAPGAAYPEFSPAEYPAEQVAGFSVGPAEPQGSPFEGLFPGEPEAAGFAPAGSDPAPPGAAAPVPAQSPMMEWSPPEAAPADVAPHAAEPARKKGWWRFGKEKTDKPSAAAATPSEPIPPEFAGQQVPMFTVEMPPDEAAPAESPALFFEDIGQLPAQPDPNAPPPSAAPATEEDDLDGFFKRLP